MGGAETKRGTLHEAVIDYLDEPSKNDFADLTARRHVTEETGHGREEMGSSIQMPVPKDLYRVSDCGKV
jgi:hypothetical protein